MNPNMPGLDDLGESGSASVDPAELEQQQGSQPSEADQPAHPQDEAAEVPEASEPAAAEYDVAVEAEVETSAPEAEAEPAPAELAHESGEPDAPVHPVEAVSAPPAGRGVRRGDLVEGTITQTSPTAVMLDLGVDVEGVIPSDELDKMTKGTLESLKPGEKLMVYVVNPNHHSGNIIVSVNRAIEELDWQRAEEFRKTQEVIESRVAGYNKGGLIVRFGRVRGFVPQSQMSADRRRIITGETPEERWGKMVGEEIAVKVMEVDRARNRLILSERSATRESRERRKEGLIKELSVGEVRTGRVVSLEDFGAFIDIGGAEGLVHLTELSWKHVTHPREILQVGQEVRVEVINVDPDAKRIGLSLKSQESDPWDIVAINYNVGQLVRGKVTKLTKFGAFAQIVDLPEIEGLIHISELSDKRVNHPREVVNEGDTLTLRVVKMDIKNRRLGLSLKKVNSPEYLDQDWEG
jgi:small subunit ribosomal protein S1